MHYPWPQYTQNLVSSFAYSPSSAIPEARSSAERCAAPKAQQRQPLPAPLTEKYSGHDLTGFLLWKVAQTFYSGLGMALRKSYSTPQSLSILACTSKFHK